MDFLRRFSAAGVIVALAFFSVSLTPSLVPRPALFMGLLSGLWGAAGYFMGAAVQRLLLRRQDGRHPRRVRGRFGGQLARLGQCLPIARRKVVYPLLVAVPVLYILVYGYLVIGWQNDVRSLVEMGPLGSVDILTFAATMVLGCALGGVAGIGLGAVRRRVETSLASAGRCFAPGAGLAAAVLTAVVAIALLLLGGMALVERIYAGLNGQTAEGAVLPTSSVRSAGPGSLVSWDGLGRHGRGFIGTGPDESAIKELTGHPAMDPVRVYVGVEHADTLQERARIAVEELKRTGGLDRSVLVVATPTGSGWLEAQAVDAVEYLYSGDTAIVSTQYSYLPSWASFLFNEDLPVDASRALFEAVHAEWSKTPADERPILAVYGLSLGSFGMQGALGDLEDIRTLTDAALFVGPPNNAQPWRHLQAVRDPGSPVWQPVLEDGARVRWLSKRGDFSRLPGEWERPRVAYLQHATDAVTWLDPRVIWQRPEWLAGPAAEGGRADDVSDAMLWFPGITYAHLVADMIMGVSVPAGHGHNFGDVILDGWAGVLPGHGLDAAALDRVQRVIESYARDVEDPFWE